MKSVFNQMAFGIYGTNGICDTKDKMPIVSQMPLVPSAKQFLRK
jgi:hypothetical protein